MSIEYYPKRHVDWGNLDGTLDNQMDLAAALAGKSSTSHNHNSVYLAKASNLSDVADAATARANLVVKTYLTANTTVNITYDMTAAQIQALIDAQPKNLNGYTLTFQFSNTTAKYFNAAAVVDNSGNLAGTVALSVTGHGFVEGDVVSIDGTTNYNGDTTLPAQTGGGANTLIVTATYNAETLAATMIVRKPQILSAVLNFRGFYGCGIINVQGNTSETGANTAHTTQQCFLKFSNPTYGLSFGYNAAIIGIYRLKIEVVTSGNYAPILCTGIGGTDEDIATISYNYLKGTSTSHGYGIFARNACRITFSYNLVGTIYRGIYATTLAQVYSLNNDDYGTAPIYGLAADASTIYKSGTQPAGSTGNELKANGGQIF